MLRAAKTSAAQHLQGVCAARPRAAVKDDVAIARNRIKTPMQLAQRHVSRAFEMSLIPLIGLADIDEDEAAVIRESVARLLAGESTPPDSGQH